MALTKETQITVTQPLNTLWLGLTQAQQDAFDSKIDEMVAAGKTDGVQYAQTTSNVGIRKWLNNAAATEWITFVENTVDNALITNISIVSISND